MSLARRSGIALAFLGSIAGCVHTHSATETTRAPASVPAPNTARELSRDEQVAHVLSRLTFGARPGDLEKVAAVGVDAWIDAQLKPEAIPDSGVDVALAKNLAWATPTGSLTATQMQASNRISFTVPTIKPADTAGKALSADSIKALRVKAILSVAVLQAGGSDAFSAGKLTHAQLSERQLYEVVADFWENHFSVYSGKTPSAEAIAVFDREAIRPHALGKFRDLLGAVAHSTMMLNYLDNFQSQRDAINENYAREVMELHTLGVDGGYTQQDVIAVARAFTGWTITPPPVAVGASALVRQAASTRKVFTFLPATHDSGEKIVLGHRLAAGRGIEDGEEVLDIIARHPSTAHYIALKLSRHLVSDDPPASVVDRAAATFTRTDGDIAEVVRTIVKSPEFFSRAAFRSKVKTPFEFVVSARRALDAPADSAGGTTQMLRASLGQPTFGRLTPDGWPDRAEAWMSPGAMYNRITFGADAAAGKLRFFPVEQWSGWSLLATEAPERQAAGVIHLLLNGFADPALRDVLVKTEGTATNTYPDAARTRLRDMVAIAIGSPEFQRR